MVLSSLLFSFISNSDLHWGQIKNAFTLARSAGGGMPRGRMGRRRQPGLSSTVAPRGQPLALPQP